MRPPPIVAAVLLVLGLATALPARASELVEVLPVTDSILMLHFDDGSVTLAAPGQSTNADVVQVSPLDLTQASAAATFRVSSSDDPAYATAQAPTSVGRKSKATEFANHCDSWNGSACVNSAPDRALEHWLYLVLPAPLQHGKHYVVDTGTLASNASTTALTFDETQLRSETIHVNTVAYAAAAPQKFGYVYAWLGDLGGLDVAPLVGRTCALVRTADGSVGFSASLQARKSKSNVEIAYASDTPQQNLLGADVADCDFSSFATPGEYVLRVDGVGHSFPFRLEPDALRRPFYAAMKGLYLHRSGIAIDAAHGEGFSRPAPHNPEVTPGFAGRLKYTTTRYFDVSSGDASAADKPTWEAGILGDLDTWGWYQDAGDWDEYFSHSAIPALLLTLFEQHPDHFSDGELNIPESGNGIPDVVDEARWLIRFYHRTRHAILDAGYGTGGVGGARVMGDLWGSDLPNGLVAGSWQDTQRQWIVSGEDPWTTYRYAALAAHLGLVLRQLGKADPEGIDWQAEAIAAWTWAQANTRSGDETASAFGFTLRDLRMHAALALFRLTGTASYHDAFKVDFASSSHSYDDNSRYWALLYPRLSSADADPAILASVTAMLQARASDELASTLYDRAARWGGNFYMPMFLGEGSTPLISDGVLALELLDGLAPADRQAMRARAYTTADYFLGTNPLNMTWVSRLGPRFPRPFTLDGFAEPGSYPPMGLVPYGPVATARDFFPSPPPGPWASNWASTSVYPADIETWPGHERWFDQRIAIASCEFTVEQTILPSAIVFGALLDVADAGSAASDGGAMASDAGSSSDGGAAALDGGQPGAGNVSPGVDAGGGAQHVTAGCGCLTADASSLPLLALLLLAALGRRAARTKRS